MKKQSRVYIAGHSGLVGSAIVKKLTDNGYRNILSRSHKELDLMFQKDVDYFFKEERPEYVFLAAARVGGIKANSSYPADFITENQIIQSNIIMSSHKYKVKKLLFFGSSCMYPRISKQPIKEEYLLEGCLEPTNEAYALAKILGVKMCEYFNIQYGTKFISAVPSNLYGPNDNFDLENCHVIPSLIRKMYNAQINNQPYLEVWGTGNATRDFLYIDDMAEASLFLMNFYDEDEHINIGTGEEVSIRHLAELTAEVVGYNGKLVFDASKPDGMPRKVLDASKLALLGWKPNITLEEGIRRTYRYFLKTVAVN